MSEIQTTTPTPGKRLPRYEGGSRLGVEAFALPIPPRLLDAMADTPEAKRHAEIGQHFAKAKERAIKLAGDLEKTKEDDLRARAIALSAGKTPPAPKSERIELDLRQAREDVSLLAELLRDSADELLRAAVPYAADAYAAAGRDAEGSVERVRELLEATRAALEEADVTSGEVAWLGSLVKRGIVYPHTSATRARSLPIARQAILSAIGGLQEDLLRRGEAVESVKREEAAKEKPPPGATIWKEGQEFRVADDGELVEVPR